MARVRVLADEMWPAASGPQGQLGYEHYPRLGIYPARRGFTLQSAERSASWLHRHERREPTASDGAGKSGRSGRDLRTN